jgi:predicted dehydrogenase
VENLIIVGCGDHYRTNVGPCLASLETGGEAKVIATVDIEPLAEDPLRTPVPHVIRQQGESLSLLLRRFEKSDPVVVLAHSHEWHAADALDLVSCGFRVILEKPYALTVSDLSLIRQCIHSTPQRLALAESYLMMTSAPLLHAAGLLKPDSFYLREPGYLEGVGEKTASVESLAGVLASIGRPRMVYVDLLEGEGLTGRFEHRGRQFADSRVGIGVILDLAIHALAPVVALDGLLGNLPRASSVSLATAVCETFLRFAGSSYKVPPQFVPETYAEMSFTTSVGIPVILAVGKYVLRNENQRRLLIVGDEGEALLDMSNCTLSIARTDRCPVTLLRSPKRADTRYRAVFRACLLGLEGKTPYNFSASEIALHSNEFTSELHSRACEQGQSRRKYPSGAAPGTILEGPHHVPLSPPVL